MGGPQLALKPDVWATEMGDHPPRACEGGSGKSGKETSALASAPHSAAESLARAAADKRTTDSTAALIAVLGALASPLEAMAAAMAGSQAAAEALAASQKGEAHASVVGEAARAAAGAQ